MAWSIKADVVESCSCASICPCVLGPAKPDQEWCSGAFGIRITDGNSEGVDLSGATMAIQLELPGDFMGGIDKAKLYLDSSLSEDQRREIDAVFHGERGGVWGGMKEAIKEWLPSTVAKVTVSDGDAPSAQIEGIGGITLQPVKQEDGTPTVLSGAPVLAAFGMAKANIANGSGTKFSDPDMRSWESLGHGSTIQVEWAG
jgi:hypothetical protein